MSAATTGTAFLRFKKIKGNGIITVAARHNRRELQAEMGATDSIDPTHSQMNETLQGPSTAAGVGQLAKDLMAAAGVGMYRKPRKDAVSGIELVFSLPPEHGINDRSFFIDCAAWAGKWFGGVQNILSVDIHRDEAQCHCHVLILPLLPNGKMNASTLVGGPAQVRAMHEQFHKVVASRYGFKKAPERLSGARRAAAATAVLRSLAESSDPALKSRAWSDFHHAIEADPARFAMTLGIELKAPVKRMRTMAAIFTSTGKGGNRE